MRILITTQTHDMHACAVAAALGARGHAVDLHYGGDFPARQWQSLRVGAAAGRRIDCGDDAGPIGYDHADVFWNRRFVSGTLPETLHPADREFARREWRHVAAGLHAIAAPDAFWINPQAAAQRARLKPVQVAWAHELGLAVPETLIGNDPDEIRAFAHAVGRAIYKPCTSVGWRNGDRYASVYTAPISAADLRDDATLRACPGIYQARVEKAFEVRATVMGASCLAMRIETSSHPAAAEDWRRAQSLGLGGEPTQVPPPVWERMQALMQRLGLVFGCFDFIVTPQGEWVFLEVNEMGQFLWVESLVPQLPMLDAFVRFVESADPDFRYQPAATTLRLQDVLADGAVEQRMQLDATRHVRRAPWFVHAEGPEAAAEAAAA